MVSELIQSAQTDVDNQSFYVCGDQGCVTLEEVPARWREKVREALENG